jgi:NAD(P)-dependent dehydrogenase (short-subunit alcohol dehydrogenase family)
LTSDLSKRLNGKTVVVTGAAGLLGREHCRAILLNGGTPVLLDSDASSLELAITALKEEFHIPITGFVCDITDESVLKEISQEIESKLGLVNGLVNNASVNPSVENKKSNFDRVETLSKEVWVRELEVGLYGTFLCTKIFGGRLKELKKPGSIIMISSDHGIIAPKQSLYKLSTESDSHPVKPVTYSVVKHGQIGLAKYFSTYWAEFGIRINALCPGGVENNQNKDFMERVSHEIPLGRLAHRNEYHGALVFLLSDESSYMTGANLVVDGGRSVW